MTEYYKSIGNIQFIYKIRDNKIYFYNSKTKRWRLSVHATKQYILKWYDYTPLTLLDMVMLGIPK